MRALRVCGPRDAVVVSTHSLGSFPGLGKTLDRTGIFLIYFLVLILLIDAVSTADVDERLLSTVKWFKGWGEKNCAWLIPAAFKLLISVRTL